MFQLIPCICHSTLNGTGLGHTMTSALYTGDTGTLHVEGMPFSGVRQLWSSHSNSGFDVHNIVCCNGEAGVTKTGTMTTSSMTGLWSHCCGC